MDAWIEAVLETLPASGASIAFEDFLVLACQARGLPRDNQFDDALAALQAAKLVARFGGGIFRTEPDYEERSLEGPITTQLSSDYARSQLRITDAGSVFAATMRGGVTGAGRWSRPDFTIAAVRQWRYDPLRHLDVFSFELKNRLGTSVVAVHEALAHTRFSHYAYLVCPRSALRPEDNEELGEECARHGVGLILFNLSVGEQGSPSVSGFQFEIHAARANPTPERVEQHLDERLPPSLSQRLIELARAQ